MDLSQIHSPLLIWYRNNQRNLPWRLSPNAYSVWISEIILQQTRVEQGRAYYDKIISRVPSVCDMAKLEEEEMLFLWQGLGYYSRARNMLHTAKTVCNEHQGKFPNNYIALLKLKGIGPYTAAAIASIAFNEQKAAVDGNLIRVISRLLALPGKTGPQLQKEVQKHADLMIPKEHPGDFNQAMMDLGSAVCTPRNPLCGNCPLHHLCIAFKQGNPEEIPQPKDKIKVRKRFFNYLLFIDEKELCLITKRRQKDIWQGLYEFPLRESLTKVDIDKEWICKEFAIASHSIEILEHSSYIKHLLSHQHIFGQIALVRCTKLPTIDGSERIDTKDLDTYAKSVLIQKLLKSVNHYL